MKKRASSQRKRSTQTYSEEQLAGLRASTATRKQETLDRLRAAIASLKDKQQAITAQSIYAESGLHYSSLLRNPEAIALFRANSAHLNTQKKRTRRMRKTSEDTLTQPPSRDPWLNYKKSQLVVLLRELSKRFRTCEDN
jgi:hypothetical protein